MFGTEIKDGNIDAFYHGIGQKLLFPSYIGTYWYPDYGGLIINCPLSTSSSYVVATRFTNNNNGIIIQFGDTKLWAYSAKYFSVSWLSDYGSESEYLFIENEWALQIINICDTNLGYQYKYILKSLRIISGITGNNKPYNDEITLKMKQVIVKILCYQLSDTKSLDLICEYAKQLINIYFENQKELTLNYSTIKHDKYSFLFDIFSYSECEWIKLNELTKLFPNVVHLQITNINFSEEMLKYICNYFSIKNSVCPTLIEILIHLNESQGLSISQYICKYKDKLLSNGVSITRHDLKQLIVKQTQTV